MQLTSNCSNSIKQHLRSVVPNCHPKGLLLASHSPEGRTLRNIWHSTFFSAPTQKHTVWQSARLWNKDQWHCLLTSEINWFTFTQWPTGKVALSASFSCVLPHPWDFVVVEAEEASFRTLPPPPPPSAAPYPFPLRNRLLLPLDAWKWLDIKKLKLLAPKDSRVTWDEDLYLKSVSAQVQRKHTSKNLSVPPVPPVFFFPSILDTRSDIITTPHGLSHIKDVTCMGLGCVKGMVLQKWQFMMIIRKKKRDKSLATPW